MDEGSLWKKICIVQGYFFLAFTLYFQSLNHLDKTRHWKETLFIILLKELELYVLYMILGTYIGYLIVHVHVYIYVPDNIAESHRSWFEF